MQEEKSELPKKLHKTYNAEVRREHLNTWQDSGLSMSEYCRRHQLGVSTLSKWALESGISTKVKLKPLKMPSPSLSISNISPLEMRNSYSRFTGLENESQTNLTEYYNSGLAGILKPH